MDEWVDRLAASLVEQLQPRVPDVCVLTIEGSGADLVVWCSGEAGMGFGAVAAGADGAGVEAAVRALLSHIEDWVARTTAEPFELPRSAVRF